MRLIVAFLAAFVVFQATADQISVQGDDSLRLTEMACPAEILALVDAEYHAELRFAVGTVGGKKYPACWLERYEIIFLKYLDGDLGKVPASMFSPAKDAV